MSRNAIRILLITVTSAFVLFFQNCSVYQSPQRKLLEEKGIHFLGTTCEPFISPAALIDLYNVAPTTFVEITPGTNSSGNTCKIIVPGAASEELGLINCYFPGNARGDFDAWLADAYTGSTRKMPGSWTLPPLEGAETSNDRRFLNLYSRDKQGRVAEGYLRVITDASDATVMGLGAFRTNGAQVVKCVISMRASELSRTVSRPPGCQYWDLPSGGTPSATISVRDLSQCFLENVVDLFVDQTK